MNDREKYWFRLMYYWCNNKGRTGLTIPYLIGAQNVLNIENPLTIRELLKEIKQSDLQNRIVLQHCGQLKEFVIGDKRMYYGAGNKMKIFDSIGIYSDDTIKCLDKFDHVIDYLESIYQRYVDSELFSKIGDEEWEYFQKKDINMILKVIG